MAPADDEGHALYNPFGSVGVAVVQVPAPAASVPPPLEAGDWSLPVVVAVAGFGFVGWLLRQVVA